MVDYQVDDNPYDPATIDQQPQTLPLDEVIRLAFRTLGLQQFNVWRPAQVMSVAGNNRVNLQIQLQALYVDEDDPFTIPQLQNVVVWMPHGSKYQGRFPLSEGDNGIALYCDRSLDAWKSSDGDDPVDPGDSRAHDLNDAVFIPGLDPFSQAIQDATDDFFFGNGDGSAQLRFTQDGDIQLPASGSVFLGVKDADSPAVLGDVLQSGLDAILEQIGNINSALQTLLEAMTTGAADWILVTGAPGGPSPINPTIAAAIVSATTTVTAAIAALEEAQSEYIDTAATNFQSQQTFLQRGGS